MKKYITKAEAIKIFKSEYKEQIKEMSNTDRRLTWNDFTQHLYDNGQISHNQLYTWDQPKFLTKKSQNN